MNFADIRSWVKRCPEIYGDLVYRCRNTVGKTDLPVQFKKIVTRYKKKKKKKKKLQIMSFPLGSLIIMVYLKMEFCSRIR